MDNKTQALDHLGKRGSEITQKHALVGFDGLVERVTSVVDKRFGQGNAFSRVETIEAFGSKILGAAGKGAKMEIFTREEKAGGSGPAMAEALGRAGLNLRYIGALGETSVHPVFENFARETNAISIADPAIIHCLEFADGKIKLGTVASLDAIGYRKLLRHLTEGEFFDLLSRQDLVSVVNWAMIPNLTTLLTDLLDYVIPNLPPRDQKHYFFDLSDPVKRSDGEVRSVLSTLSRFQNWGAVTLGLNVKVAGRVARLLGQSELGDGADGLKSMASYIRDRLSIGTAVVQAGDSAACATKLETVWAKGTLTKDPPATGGSADHFNAGFCLAQLLDFPLSVCLTTGEAFRGFHAVTGRSPSMGEAQSYIQSWK